MTQGVWLSIDRRCLVMKNSSSLTLIDQKLEGYSSDIQNSFQKLAWSTLWSQQNGERHKLARLPVANVHIWPTGDRGRCLRFWVCALGQFLFERKEYPLYSSTRCGQGFSFIDTQHLSAEYFTCRGEQPPRPEFQAGQAQDRSRKTTVSVVICPGEETLLKNVDSI